MAREYDAPKGLEEEGVALWDDITAVYDLRPDELRVLEAACFECDLIARMQRQSVTEDLIVVGSQGQPVANPLVQELRQHRSTLRGLLGQLKLPDEDGRAAASRSAQARDAAGARWKRGA
jgi:hypothetical protein